MTSKGSDAAAPTAPDSGDSVAGLVLVGAVLLAIFWWCGYDLIDLREAMRSVIFACLVSFGMVVTWLRARSDPGTDAGASRGWARLAGVWLVIALLQHVGLRTEELPGTVESDAIRTYHARSSHEEHDLLFRDQAGRQWHAHYDARAHDAPVPAGTAANATIDRGLLWDEAESLQLPDRRLDNNRVP